MSPVSWGSKEHEDSTAAPLRGVRVLDLSRLLSGPFATHLLGNLGAEIIKVERPNGGDDTRRIIPLISGESFYFMSVNTNKRSIVLDLKHDRGRRIVHELARDADVVLENFRPGVAKRLGLGFEDLHAQNEKLIYCSISAFGQDGPWAQRGAFDLVVQALSGFMSVNGTPDGPPVRLGLPMGDLSAGIFAAIGVLGALVERSTTGIGQYIDVAMLDSSIGLLGYLSGWALMLGESPPRVGNGHQSLVPYGVYATSDGYVAVAVFTDPFWPKLCKALGLDELAWDERFDTMSERVAHREEIDAVVGAAMRALSLTEALACLVAHDVPHAPVLDVKQSFNLEQVVARGLVQVVTHEGAGQLQVVGPVVRYAGKRRMEVSPAPVLGADTEEVLASLGYSPEDIEQLCKERVIEVASRRNSE
ncbi:MAG: CoA transferase [Actinomycetota bacterium]|nr:CoA transferase [Actinomycetota bacterium]